MVKRNHCARSPFQQQPSGTACSSAASSFPIWETELGSYKVQVPGTAIMGVQQKHLEAKLRGESSARACMQGEEISWWAFRQRAEMWTLPQCWKQCMNKILHDCSSSHISITHSHHPQGLSPEIKVSTWSVQQPRQLSDPALSYTHPTHSAPAPRETRMLQRLEHGVLTCSCCVPSGPALREHFWGGTLALTEVLQPNREQRSFPQQAHAKKAKEEKNKGSKISVDIFLGES